MIHYTAVKALAENTPGAPSHRPGSILSEICVVLGASRICFLADEATLGEYPAQAKGEREMFVCVPARRRPSIVRQASPWLLAGWQRWRYSCRKTYRLCLPGS
jgi:hypothetical protein